VVTSPSESGPALRAVGIANDVDLTDDPLIARSTRLIRLGGLLPPLVSIAILVIVRVLRGGPVHLAVTVGLVVVAGQALVWRGVLGLRKSQGWASGVGFYLTVGGVLSAQTLYLTGIPAIMPIPLVAPLFGGLAKRRLQRRTRRESAP
jgi:hypothetical protein